MAQKSVSKFEFKKDRFENCLRLYQIAEIRRELSDVRKLQAMRNSWPNCASRSVIDQMATAIMAVPKMLAIEMVGRFLACSAEFVYTKLLRIRDLFGKPKFVLIGCALIDLGTLLATEARNEALVRRFEMRAKLSAAFARLSALGNEGISS